ncbi:FAD/NAD(P)-binding protein, partial [Kitasatospora nipponensis]|uniref:FAD/NAD(P)-binding protein n=1 Tax=Kitasatospora nipponensis TaxID=258049 RepID=UPI0031CE05D5
MSDEASLCVVGAGPRGLSVLERICANRAVPGRTVRPLTVHLVEAVRDGGARVWRTDQPTELLMNTVACQVSMFTDESVECAGPVRPGPNLHEWARFMVLMDREEEYPEPVLAEARALGPDSYPSRAFYGRYLDWVLRRLVRTAPPGTTVRIHRARATALDDDADGTQTLTLDSGEQLSGLHAVVLAQGHVDSEPTGAELELQRFAEGHQLGYFPPGNPADLGFETVRPGEAVLLRGLGLNFFDCMAALTIGRGGRFERVGGRLVYQPSGREPQMYAGSRRGIPHHARGENQKGASGRHEPVFLGPETIRTLRAAVDQGRPLDFREQIWPLISREVRLVYYRTLLVESAGRRAAAAFEAEFVALGATADESAEAQLLDRHRVAGDLRWDWDRIIRPYGEREFADHEEYRQWLLAHLRRDLAEAALGNVDGPLKAALDVLRDLRNEIRLVVDHGGLTGRSYREDLQGWYTPLNAFLSIGPPAARIEQLIALAEAGTLQLLGPGLSVVPDASGKVFRAVAASIPDGGVEVTTLIEARLPESDLRRTVDPLLRHLLATGQCASYRLPGDTDGDFLSGGLAVTPRPYRLVDARGRAHPARFAFGVPTETVHWVTAAGIRPG